MEKMINVMDVAELPADEMMSILRQGSVLRLPYLEERLRTAQAQLQDFERRYDTTLATLLAEGLPDDADYRMHEDFIEWEHWHDVAQETETIITNVKRILSKVGEDAGVLR